ncbi:MAG: hypothetical protein OCD00_09945 [Colwellia sp.]
MTIVVMQSKKNSRDICLDAVKGFLILCIILEHNSLLVAENNWIRPFSDAFAAGCFLILTFAWPIKKNTFVHFLDKHFAYWWPFLGFISITSILNFFLFSNIQPVEAIQNYLNALFLASPQAIKASSGFMYFWFLPCLSLLYLFRLLAQKIRTYSYVIAIIAWLFIGEINEELLVKAPFSLHVIAFIFILGLCYSKLHIKLIQQTFIIKTITILGFISCSILSYFIGWKLFLAGGKIPSVLQPELILFYSIYMLIAIPGIYNILTLLPSIVFTFFAYMGHHSMKIYLLHPLVFITITQIIPVTKSPLLSFIITIALSFFISFIIVKLPLIDKFIFPKTLSALKLKRNL